MINTRNMKMDKSLPIRTVTNVRTLFDIMNEVEIGKTMLLEVFLCFAC